MPRKNDDIDRLRDEAHKAAEALAVRAREIRQIINDLPANTSKASRSHLDLLATHLDEVAAGLSTEAKEPDPESFWLRIRLAARKCTIAAVTVTALTVGQGAAEAAGADFYDRAKEVASDLKETSAELRQLEEVPVLSSDISISTGQNLLDLSPVEFEELVGRLLVAMGQNVEATSQTSDAGYDFKYQTDDRIYLVEAKRVRSKVGAQQLRQILGSMTEQGADGGVLVTTSDFTNAARQLADRRSDLQLVDGSALIEQLKRYLDIDATLPPDDDHDS